MGIITPDFERDRYEGQMNPEERACLYDMIMQAKPETVWEIGTCRGGGSTYYISTALHNMGRGVLHTFEGNKEFYDYAVRLYETVFTAQAPYVRLHYGDTLRSGPAVLRTIDKIDVLFMDGGPDGIMAVHDYAAVWPKMDIGSLLITHDWGESKCQYLRPILENAVDWKKLDVVIDLAVFQRVRNVHGYEKGEWHVT